MALRIGTSGWQYADWRGAFYPEDVPQRRWLSYLANKVNSVEINGSFYSLQRPTSYQRWAAQTPLPADPAQTPSRKPHHPDEDPPTNR